MLSSEPDFTTFNLLHHPLAVKLHPLPPKKFPNFFNSGLWLYHHHTARVSEQSSRKSIVAYTVVQRPTPTSTLYHIKLPSPRIIMSEISMSIPDNTVRSAISARAALLLYNYHT